MTLPSYRDPRYLQVLILLSYAIVAREVFHFERTHLTAIACCVWAMALDLILGRVFYKKLIFPLSSLIIGLSSSILVYSHSVVPYLAITTLAVLSKTIITYKGKHFFNPTNFGVVIALQFAPDYVTGHPTLFSGYITPSIIFAVLGLATVLYARQAEVSLSWLAGFLGFAALRAGISSTSPWNKMLPMFGPSFLLFTFHMISDPATVPKTRPFRILFGILVAVSDAGYRYLEIPNGLFYSLLIASSLMPWIREYEAKKCIAAG